MDLFRRAAALHTLAVFCILASGCSATSTAFARSSLAGPSSSTTFILSAPASATEGVIQSVRDPSLIHVNGAYYVFITDNPAWTGSLPILCSPDAAAWKQCGSVFPRMPAWIPAKLPGITNLWAPDISFFNGQYHVYYTASLANTENTLIGLATNTTLDPTDPDYKWVDRGDILDSHSGDAVNVLDPNILVDSDGSIWLSYGSYWGGIAQRQIDPSTGLLTNPNAPSAALSLAARPSVPVHPIEGSSQLYHDGFYYLFVSIDYCCNASLATNDYKMAVGRSPSPHGPFLAQDGTPMLQGGSTVILTGDVTHWVGVGGGTVYDDPATGDTDLVFHAQPINGNGVASLWFKKITWVNGWPVLS
jgi:arabinan endo-1,5-alpha-L-arabinosidase